MINALCRRRIVKNKMVFYIQKRESELNSYSEIVFLDTKFSLNADIPVTVVAELERFLREVSLGNLAVILKKKKCLSNVIDD